MLKKLLLTGALIISALAASASHLMGGELTVKVTSGDTAYFTLTLYRDMNGAGLGNTASISVVQNTQNTSVLLNLVKKDTIPSPYYPVESFVYEGSLHLAAYQANQPIGAFYYTCCRNGAIQNLSNPSGSQFAVQTSFQKNNQTPVFLEMPVVDWPIDTLWSYNPLPFEADGDSLYWSLDTPKVWTGTGIGHASGYSLPPAHPGGDMSIDPASGVITYKASQLGNYVYSVRVEEFDSSGQKVGQINREMQIICRPDTLNSGMNLVINSSTSSQNGMPVATFVADSSQELKFTLTTNDSNATLTMSMNGEPFQLPNSDASFSSMLFKSSAQTLEGSFSWTPQRRDRRAKAYPLNLRISDGLYQYDYALAISVDGVVSLRELSGKAPFSLYPNPSSNGQFTLDAGQLEAGIYHAELLDMSGRLIWEKMSLQLAPAEQLEFSKKLQPGSYLFKLNGKKSYSRILMVR